MSKFFAETSDGDGYLIRKQTQDIVLNNLFWLGKQENDLVTNLAVAE